MAEEGLFLPSCLLRLVQNSLDIICFARLIVYEVNYYLYDDISDCLCDSRILMPRDCARLIKKKSGFSSTRGSTSGYSYKRKRKAFPESNDFRFVLYTRMNSTVCMYAFVDALNCSGMTRKAHGSCHSQRLCTLLFCELANLGARGH